MSSKVPLTEAQWRRIATHMRDAGLPKRTIDAVREAFNIASRPKWKCLRIDDALIQRSRELLEEGLSLREVGRRVGRCHGTIRLALNRAEKQQRG